MIGIGEAAFHMASLIAHRFSVVTTLSRSIAPIEANLVKYGLDRRCARVRACEVPVLALDDPGFRRARKALGGDRARAEAKTAPTRSCSAAPAWPNSPLNSRAEHGAPVVDGVACAVKLIEALVGLGFGTSKRGPTRAVAEAVYWCVCEFRLWLSGLRIEKFGMPNFSPGAPTSR